MISGKYIEIIRCLRENSRESLTNMSKKIGAPVSTIYDRVKCIENKFVKKHTSLIDFEKMGFLLRANILMKSIDKNEVNEFILRNKNINSAFELRGNFDFFLDCIFKDRSDFNSFMDRILSLPLHSKEMYFITGEIKREEFLV